MKKLIKRGANVKSKNNEGNTSLHYSAEKNE
jgi:ankyrin repeat protein